MTKKLILSFAALAISFAAMSQVRVGVKGGWNLANISTRNDGSTDDTDSLVQSFPFVQYISYPKNVGKGWARARRFWRVSERRSDLCRRPVFGAGFVPPSRVCNIRLQVRD